MVSGVWMGGIVRTRLLPTSVLHTVGIRRYATVKEVSRCDVGRGAGMRMCLTLGSSRHAGYLRAMMSSVTFWYFS